MDYEDVADKVKEAAGQILDKEGLELIELTWRRHGRRMVLRFLVDKPDSAISMAECIHLNEAIGELLDKKDLIQTNYTLEVSSPGLDRPLVERKDFERNIGRKVRLVTTPLGKEEVLVGKLGEVDEENIVIIKKDGSHNVIPRKTIAKARLEVEF